MQIANVITGDRAAFLFEPEGCAKARDHFLDVVRVEVHVGEHADVDFELGQQRQFLSDELLPAATIER